MENNKLQELTDKLYNEGLLKGKQQAEELSSNAQREAERIISDAKAQAQAIVLDAQKKAEDLTQKVTNDLKMASTQTISSLKQQIEKFIVTKSIAPKVDAALTDTQFIKDLISTIVGAFKVNDCDSDLSIILDANSKQELDSFLKNELSTLLNNGIEIQYSKQIGKGFKIGPKDGGYYISFKQSDFEQMLAAYLRPATKRILFG